MLKNMIILTTEIMDLVQDTYAWLVLTKSLARRASFDSNQKSFPSIETISKDVNISKPTTIKALQYLKEIGIIQIKKVQKQGFVYRNEYFILTDKIKTVGSVKINSPVKEVDSHQSTTFTCASKSNLPVPVKEVDSNLKNNFNLKSNNHIIKNFFENENLNEIVKETITPLDNQEWDNKQAKATLELTKETMLDYYESEKKPIKNITLTFKNWIKKHKKTDFYKYTNSPTGQSSYTDKRETRSIFRQDLNEFHYYKNDYWESPEEEQETLELAKRNNYKIIYKS